MKTWIMGTIGGLFAFTIYWLGGGNFERDEMLAVTALMSVLSAGIFVFVWSVYDEAFNEG